jgi:hypothetical protein
VRGFVSAMREVYFRIPAREPWDRDRARYALIFEETRRVRWRQLRRRGKGFILRYAAASFRRHRCPNQAARILTCVGL